jgi:hypothetical protein
MNPLEDSSPLALAGDYDVVVVAANPGGISCALRSAREGLRVLLVEASQHAGGMWASGVQVLDTRYGGHRCPILTEFVERVADHYREVFGEGSPEYAMAQFGDPSRHGERPRFEPHVAEKIFREMLRDAVGITLLFGYQPSSVNRDGANLTGSTFTRTDGQGSPLQVTARVFIDATYEADFAALAGATLRTGREGRNEFGEPHAGVHYTTIEPIGPVGEENARLLNLHFFNRTSRRMFPGSSGRRDAAVQAYTARLILTDRPDNRRAIERPPGYSRERYVGILDRSADSHTRSYPLSSHYLHGDIKHFRFFHNLQNAKMDWLGANLVGGIHAYPLADRAERRKIYEAHVEHALGMLYFLQNDAEVPESVRQHVNDWGLARDEYTDNDNIPHLIYVRESRRLAGMHIFTELDASRHPHHHRTPIHSDSIAIAEWPMDSHDCNPVRQPGSFNDGEFILAEATLPSQIPYRTMLTPAADNLLVPVCLSSTHVGWGTLRLEPVFVHTGEAAAVAALLAIQQGISVHAINTATLHWELLRRQIAVTYFADVDLGSVEPWVRDAQFLGARGFFAGYDVKPDQPVSPALANTWQEILTRHLEGECDPNEAAQKVAAALQESISSPGNAAAFGLTIRDACLALGSVLIVVAE